MSVWQYLELNIMPSGRLRYIYVPCSRLIFLPVALDSPTSVSARHWCSARLRTIARLRSLSPSNTPLTLLDLSQPPPLIAILFEEPSVREGAGAIRKRKIADGMHDVVALFARDQSRPGFVIRSRVVVEVAHMQLRPCSLVMRGGA